MIMIDDGMTYSYRGNWGKWQEQFLWRPRKIDGRWFWLRRVHYRWRYVNIDVRATEMQWAVDVFDLMQKDSR